MAKLKNFLSIYLIFIGKSVLSPLFPYASLRKPVTRLLILTSIFLHANLFGNSDSLYRLIAQSDDDEVKANSYLKLSTMYRIGNPDTALWMVEKGLEHALNTKDKMLIADLYYQQGLVYRTQRAYDEALGSLIRYHELKTELNDSSGIANSHLALAKVYKRKEDLAKAFEHYFKAAEILEEIREYYNLVSTYSGIGTVHAIQKKPERAEEYFLHALSFKDQLEDTNQICFVLNNLGGIYNQMGLPEKALPYYMRALKIHRLLEDHRSVSGTLNNIGNAYESLDQFSKAMDYFNQSLEIKRQMKDARGVLVSLINMGDLSNKLGDPDLAIHYFNRADSLARKVKSFQLRIYVYYGLAASYKIKKDYKKALAYHDLHAQMKDSLFDETTSKQLSEMETRFETTQKEKEIELLQKDKALQALEIDRQKAQRNLFILGFGLVLALVVAIMLAYQQKRKANKLLALQKKEIEDQKEQILSSIHYAQRIQNAILPEPEVFKKLLPESFILYRPKDIVSGDFFWISSVDQAIIVAVADCTGHGVPGAFMSMIGNSLLNEVVNEKRITQPARILDELKAGIIRSLKQSGVDPNNKGGLPAETNVKDGMDIALCKIDPDTLQVEFAGAYNPLIRVRKNTTELEEIRGDRQPIGIHHSRQSQPFTNHRIAGNPGDMIYLYSDGYMDQFGGERNKKFSSRRFKELLRELHSLEPEEQKSKLETTLDQWQWKRGQIDDVCVVGIRL